MSTPHIAVAVLLVVVVASTALSVAGAALMPGALNRLHYLALPSTVGAGALAAAVMVRQELDSRGVKALVVVGILAGLNPVLVHAIARSARHREPGTDQ